MKVFRIQVTSYPDMDFTIGKEYGVYGKVLDITFHGITNRYFVIFDTWTIEINKDNPCLVVYRANLSETTSQG